MRLKGRRLLVTGGASGIGRATVDVFIREGARVAVIDRNAGALAVLAEALPDAVVARADVSSEEQVNAAIEHAANALGGLDGLANVAGIGTRCAFDDTTLDIMKTDIEVNLLGPFLVCKAALPYLKHAGKGTIVNVASGLAIRPTEGRTAYAASKGGLIVMSKAIAVDLASHNIRVNVVCPGLIDTPLVSDTSHGPTFSPEQLNRLMDRRLIKRLGMPRELADAIAFLTSDESSFMTASVLAVDGGGTMH